MNSTRGSRGSDLLSPGDPDGPNGSSMLEPDRDVSPHNDLADLNHG